jgi:hypothetical protein
MPARQEPRVDAEPHGGLPAVTGPDRFRPNPAEIFEAVATQLSAQLTGRGRLARAVAKRPRQ